MTLPCQNRSTLGSEKSSHNLSAEETEGVKVAIFSHPLFGDLLTSVALLKEEMMLINSSGTDLEYVESRNTFVDCDSPEEFMEQYLEKMKWFRCEFKRSNTEQQIFLERYLKRIQNISAMWEEEDSNSMTGSSEVNLKDDSTSPVPSCKRKLNESRSIQHQRVKKKKKRNRLPKAANDVLISWFLNHEHHPYPTLEEKASLSHLTGLGTTQIRNWFTNIRKRHWTPVVQKGKDPRSYIDLLILNKHEENMNHKLLT